MDKEKRSIKSLIPAMRISFALAMLSCCIILAADIFGFAPSEDQIKLDARKQMSESLAIQFSMMKPEKDLRPLQDLLRIVTKRNPQILSAGVRLADGSLVYSAPQHTQVWKLDGDLKSTSTQVKVPLLKKGELWGTVEILYEPLGSESLAGFTQSATFQLLMFIIVIGFFVYLVFVLRTLKQLDPASVIPERVNAAFDTLAEGVIIVDENENILLVNKAFTEFVDLVPAELIGKKASSMKWRSLVSGDDSDQLPWLSVLKTGVATSPAHFSLSASSGAVLKFAMSVSPIGDLNDGGIQGALITLNDITEIEERNAALQNLVSELEETQVQVNAKNKELAFLATRDPMTGCLNRRSFDEQFDVLFEKAELLKSPLACIMVDLDHFKSVNDNFGHAVGDEVIILLAEVLKMNTRANDLVGRYGGEEFCLVIPGLQLDAVIKVAERIRLRIKDEATKKYSQGGPKVTASIGIASMKDGAKNHGELNQLADQALYCAKENGRNRVVSWNSIEEVQGGSEVAIVRNDTEQAVAEGDESDEVACMRERIAELEALASQFSSELEYNDNYDRLTGLPNQMLFRDRVKQAIDRGFRHSEVVAVLIIDIEMFSQINAGLGRAGGDELLKLFASRLNQLLRNTDDVSRLSLSRFGADEFAIMLNDVLTKDKVTWVLKRLMDDFDKPFTVGSNSIYLKCRIGIGLYPDDATNVDELLNTAVSAKQYVKEQQVKNGFMFYDSTLQSKSIDNLQLEEDLRRSIVDEDWVLHYQPKISIKGDVIVGCEALIRWNHPQKGLLGPFAFIEFAEQRGHILSIGSWVINETCRQIREWIDQGLPPCKVAINLSGQQLVQDTIVEEILGRLSQYELSPKLLELEITETILMDNLDKALESLGRLHSRGISIAIDDFGTGYSSLSYLKSLPIDRLKIDRAFVIDMCRDTNDQKIVKTIISMAHSMEMSVIAEGVEDTEQLEMLRSLGADEIQGYLFGKPIAAEGFSSILSANSVFTEDAKMVGGGVN